VAIAVLAQRVSSVAIIIRDDANATMIARSVSVEQHDIAYCTLQKPARAQENSVHGFTTSFCFR
jgi:hypothetical protein